MQKLRRRGWGRGRKEYRGEVTIGELYLCLVIQFNKTFGVVM